MKYLENDKIDIKLISESDLNENKKVIIDLLEENLKLNFQDFRKLREFAVNSYENMVRFNKDNSAILVGAFKEKIIVGFIWAYRRELLGEKRMHLDHIVVEPTARSSGIGSRLLYMLEDISRNEGVFKIELMTTVVNENTMRFYNSKGFSIVRVQLEKELGQKDDNR